MRRSFKYRLYPSHIQTDKLQSLLDAGRTLYNLALEQRRDAWKTRQLSLNYYDQAAQLKELRDAFPQLSVLNYSACQDTLRRLQKSFDGFFRRIKIGQAGFPRFKGKDRFDSIVFPSYGNGVKLNNKLRIQNVGLVRIKLHREIQGTIKTVTVKREGLRWYTIFSCDNVPARAFPVVNQDVGIDVGLIAVENIGSKELIEQSSTGLSKSISDAAWSQFLNILSHKAEEAGRRFIRVNPRGTTSSCSQCGKEKKKSLSERLHVCECGLNISRDLNASLNILRLGRSPLAT